MFAEFARRDGEMILLFVGSAVFRWLCFVEGEMGGWVGGWVGSCRGL